MVIMVIPLLGVKTRCANKSTAEHYELHTYILSHFIWHFSEWIEGTLCAQLLQFNTDTFEILQTL